MTEILAGIRVVDLSVALGVPWLGRHLAYHGAEVIKVESSRHPETFRDYVPPYAPKGGKRPTESPFQTEWHGGKLSLGLDLAAEEASRIVDDLVKVSDIVLVNRPPRSTEAAGTVYSRYAAINPAIIMLHNTGYGLSGPYANNSAFGGQIEAMAGMAHLLRDPETGEPGSSGFVVIDYMVGLYGLFAVLDALHQRRVTGKGQFIDIAMLETAVSSLGDVLLEYQVSGIEPPTGNRLAGAAPYGSYPCEQGSRWCAIEVRTQEQWETLCRLMGEAGLAADPRFADYEAREEHKAELDQLLGAWTINQPAYGLMYRLQEAQIPAGVVQDAKDLLQDPQLRYSGFFPIYIHPTQGGVFGTGLAVRLADEPGERALRAGRSLGQDTKYVLSALLGKSDAEIQDLLQRGVIEMNEDS